MSASRHLVRLATSGGLRGFVFCIALIGSALSHIDRAGAQAAGVQTPTVGAPSAPSSGVSDLGSAPGSGSLLELGQWILSPTLDISTLYDTNIKSAPTNALSGPGLHFHPALLLDYNTGIHDTQIYGNIDSTVYPTLNYINNTFNQQAGMTEKYSPLPDLLFTVQGNYTHSTNASVLQSSIPAPITSPGSPVPTGSAAVAATQQIVFNPNDVYTLTGTIDKQFNHGSVILGGTLATTQYEQNSAQNLINKNYNGSGSFWLSPAFYVFGDGTQSFNNPETGAASNYFRARGGINSAQIGFFSGFVYYGQQGSEVNGGGKAGGDIYGGGINYFPTEAWNMSFDVDRVRNISNITSGGLALAGLPFVPVGVSSSSSLEITTLTFKTDYRISPQTAAHLVASYSLGEQIGGTLRDTTWLADVGISHQLRQNLNLTLDYQFSSFVSPTPQSSFARNLVTLGGHYQF